MTEEMSEEQQKWLDDTVNEFTLAALNTGATAVDYMVDKQNVPENVAKSILINVHVNALVAFFTEAVDGADTSNVAEETAKLVQRILEGIGQATGGVVSGEVVDIGAKDERTIN